MARKSQRKQCCNLSGTEVSRRNMTQHQETRKCRSSRRNYTPPTTTTNETIYPVIQQQSEIINQPQSYTISVNEAEMTECPKAECPYKTNSPKAMRMHFRNKHNEDTIIIEEEGPLPRCQFCGILQRTVGEKHIQSAICKKWTAMKQEQQISKANKILIQETVFTINGAPIKSTNEFKYLGRVLERNDNDWPAVRRAIQRGQMVWGRLQCLLTKDCADTKDYVINIQSSCTSSIALWIKNMGTNWSNGKDLADISSEMCEIYNR
jgi:hypothetical protein